MRVIERRGLRLRVAAEWNGAIQPRLLAAGLISSMLPRERFGSTRAAVYRVVGGVNIARHVVLMGPIRFIGRPGMQPRNLRIRGSAAQPTYVGQGLVLNTTGRVVIDEGVTVAPNVRIDTTSHDIGTGLRRAGRVTSHTIRIGKGAWICTGATILGNVGSGAVVAAGAVVPARTGVPQNVVAGGVPASVLRTLDP